MISVENIDQVKTIVIIGPNHPLKGGIVNFTDRLATEFKNEGHYCVVYSFSFLYPNFLYPGKEQRSKLEYKGIVEILSIINSINPFNWIKVSRAILWIERPDILIINYWQPFLAPCFGFICRIIKRRSITRIVCIAHNIVPHEKRLLDRFLTKWFAKSIDGWIVMSKKVMEDLRSIVNLK